VFGVKLDLMATTIIGLIDGGEFKFNILNGQFEVKDLSATTLEAIEKILVRRR
jgi:hypothetical protein